MVETNKIVLLNYFRFLNTCLFVCFFLRLYVFLDYFYYWKIKNLIYNLYKKLY